jgi:putative ABC transport system permease protein
MRRILPKLAWRNVRRNWRHALAAMLSISVGFLAIVVTTGYLEKVDSIYEQGFSRRVMMGDVVIGKDGASLHGPEDVWNYQLREPEQRFLEGFFAEHRDEVVTRVRHLNISGMVNNGRVSRMFVGSGTDVDEGRLMRAPDWEWNAIAGRPLYLADADSLLIGSGLARALECDTDVKLEHLKPGGGYFAEERPFHCMQPRLQLTTTTESAQVNGVDATVSGIMAAGLRELDDRYVSVPLSLAQRLLDTTAISAVTVRLAPGVDAKGFVAKLLSAARMQGLSLEASRWQDHPRSELYRRSMSLFNLFRLFIVIVVLVISGMSVFNTIVKLVAERIREIGTLRALGFRRRDIVRLFSWESAMLALLSCGIGALLSLATTLMVDLLGIRYRGGIATEPIPLAILLNGWTYLWAALFLSTMAMVAAYYPARNALRVSIPDALADA